MRNKVLLITSRFGHLSDFFGLWWKSAARNLDFNFLILTDIDNIDSAENIFVKKYENFSSFISQVDNKLKFKTKIQTPFKTADLRPAYADIFENEINEVYKMRYGKSGSFDFWGYVDTDVVFGDLSKFVTDKNLDSCDVFQTWGHFMLVRNNEMNKIIYKKKYRNYSFYRSIRLPENCMNEEGPFVLQLANAGNRIDSKATRVAGIRRDTFEYKIDSINYDEQKFVYIDGKVLRYFKYNNIINVDEFMYIHFMKRIIDDIPTHKNGIVFEENGFFEFNEESLFENRFSQDAYLKWQTYTSDTNEIRNNKVSILYKLFHLENYLYRRATRNIEAEKNDFLRKFYAE